MTSHQTDLLKRSYGETSVAKLPEGQNQFMSLNPWEK